MNVMSAGINHQYIQFCLSCSNLRLVLRLNQSNVPKAQGMHHTVTGATNIQLSPYALLR